MNFAFVDGAPIVASVSARIGHGQAHLDILPGDELVSVGGKPTDATSAEELEISLAGPKSSEVKLGFERRRIDGSLVVLERTVKRERAVDEATAIPAALMLDSATGYVRVSTFMGAKVADDLHSALDSLEKSGMLRLVLDLRDNGGGSVAEAARVAGEFLPKGAIVYTSEGSKKELTDTGRVSRSFWQAQQRKYPIVMLINAGTASASELVAGALQDHDRALIMGRPSFGKSLLMLGFPLTDGSIIELVVGRVRTPCGRVIQREYRNITRHEYWRLARADRDTAGRPACKTDGGRTVYGGGGIFPDVLVDAQPGVPLWYSRVTEQLLPITWAGGYATAATSLGSLGAFVHAPVLPEAAVSDFRTYAKNQGVTIPADSASNAILARLLTRAVANSKWGEAGLYSVTAVLDSEVGEAKKEFARAAALMQKKP